MRPCDCKCGMDLHKPQEVGLSFNSDSIVVDPGCIILTLDNTTIRISQHRFKQFAEWYLAEQESTGE